MAVPIPSRAVISSGLVGLTAWAASLALAHYGIVIPPEALTPAIVGLMTLVGHVVPDTFEQKVKQLNSAVILVNEIIPQTYSAPTDFPNSPPVPTPNNLNKD